MKASQKISGQALIALKEALTHIYWRKDDLKLFVSQTITNKSFVATLDTEQVKRVIASNIVDRMSARPDLFENDLLALLKAVSDMNDFTHLQKWEDADKKIKAAKESVNALRQHTKGFFEIQKEQEQVRERKQVHQSKLESNNDFTKKLDELKFEFNKMAIMVNKQQRGFDFEKFLNAMFNLFDLDPKCSYKAAGEQIDGAFTYEYQDFLIEAKWEDKPMPKSSLLTFEGKVAGKLDNTLGLFISMSGFSNECKTREGSKVILMDYQDVINIVEQRIDLKTLIYRKKQHASQTGEILYHPNC